METFQNCLTVGLIRLFISAYLDKDLSAEVKLTVYCTPPISLVVSEPLVWAGNTHQRGKYHCMTDLLFWVDWIRPKNKIFC